MCSQNLKSMFFGVNYVKSSAFKNINADFKEN